MANKPSGAIGEDKHSQAQIASATAAAPSAGQVTGNEAKNQPAYQVTNKQPTHDADEATQATDKVASDASGDKSTSVSNEVDTAPTQETTSAKAATPSKALPELKLGEDPAPRPPSTDSAVPPPLPEKDPPVTNKPTPTSEETSVPPSQTAEPAPMNVEDKTEEPSAQPTEPEAPVTETADSSKQEADEDGPKPQSGVDGDNHAADEGSATQEGHVKADGATKLTLRTERVRELSTASMMSSSSSTPGTPADEVASSAVEEESGAPGQASTLSKSKKKRERERERKKNKMNKNKGEKNSPHPPSGETVHNADDSTIQDRKPPVVATTTTVDIPSGDGDDDGELVEKVASSEEDAPVMVNKADSSGEDSAVKVEMPQAEAEKTGDGDSGSDVWPDWQ